MSPKTVILLAMHGMPPGDFPGKDLAEWGRLHSSLEQMKGEDFTVAEKRFQELERKLRSWPRTPDNDPFHKASHDLAGKMEGKLGLRVIVAFGEFCSPSMEDGFQAAVREGAGRVVVMTPMMIRGGSHSEADIPRAIEKARLRFPNLAIDYVWPYEDSKIAEFLSEQVLPYLEAAPKA